MEKFILLLLKQLLVSKATTAVQIEHRLLSEESNEKDAAIESGRHDAYMEIAILIEDLIRDAL